MEMKFFIISILLTVLLHTVNSYSAKDDAKIIREYLRNRPKPPKDHAKVARTLVHKSNWAATGTISTVKKIEGFPMVNIISISDSEIDAPSTGNIYFLLTMLDFTGQDIEKKNQITFLISNDEDLSCTHNNHTDPMEPTCARVILSGGVVRLTPGSDEFEFGQKAVISRHPAAENWLKAHTFFLCKLNITNIFVLDWYGGPHDISVKDYYNASPDNEFNSNDIFNYENINEIPSKKNKEIHIKVNKENYNVVRIEI